VVTKETDSITLTLKGSRAERGVSLSNFETFIENFLGALRAFQREEAGVSASKTGTPERAAAVATSFRLVQLEPGSAIATLEPEPVESIDDESEQMFEQQPPQVTNLMAMLSRIEQRESLPEQVTASLDGACRALGENASFELAVPRDTNSESAAQEVVIDSEVLLELLAKEETPSTEVNSISGFLHRLDLEPDKIGIRAADGVAWTADYPEELEGKILSLVGQVVWATGQGQLQGPRRGAMKIDAIESAEPGEQSALFSKERISEDELAARQGIEGPQGLDRLGVSEWTEEDDAYLAALTED
jgi:hypothetical protein